MADGPPASAKSIHQSVFVSVYHLSEMSSSGVMSPGLAQFVIERSRSGMGTVGFWDPGS